MRPHQSIERPHHKPSCPNLESRITPELILAHAIPNGGLRNAIVAKKLKAEGVKSGVPDILIPFSRSIYSGLYIEMKKAKCWSVSENQKFWLNYLNDCGYCAIVCCGAIDAYDTTMDYLDNQLLSPKRYIIKKSKFNKKDGLNKIYQKIAIDRGYYK